MKIKDVAKKLGYDNAKKTKATYKGYTVYRCVFDRDEEYLMSGPPTYILVKDGKFRVSEPENRAAIQEEVIKTLE